MSWPYLETEMFKTRYAVAAYLIRDCDEIIEIGGYKTPITNFLTHEYKKVTVMDRKIEPLQKDKINHFPLYYQEWDGKIEYENYAIVILGLELHMEEKDWTRLYKQINNSKKTIIETPIDYKHSLTQFDKIISNTNKKIDFSIQLDFDSKETKFSRRKLHLLK